MYASFEDHFGVWKDTKKATINVKAKSKATETPETVKTEKTEKTEKTAEAWAAGSNCTLNGQMFLEISGYTNVTAKAIVPKGMAFDHWELNGALVEGASGTQTVFSLNGNTVVNAVLRDRRVISAENAYIQYEDADGKPSGERFASVDFEEAYLNPATQKNVAGGSFSGFVTADVPEGASVVYWLVNGAVYDPGCEVRTIRVENLADAAAFKPVFFQPETVKADKAEPAETYAVTCLGCTFTGGGFTNARAGEVPAGTVITVTANSSMGGRWSGSYSGTAEGGKPASFSYTVGSDCSFSYTVVIG